MNGRTGRIGPASVAAEERHAVHSRETPAGQNRRKSKERLRLTLYTALLLLDATAIALGFVIGNIWRFLDPFAAPGINYIFLFLPLYLVLSFSDRCYSIEALQE